MELELLDDIFVVHGTGDIQDNIDQYTGSLHLSKIYKHIRHASITMHDSKVSSNLCSSAHQRYIATFARVQAEGI